MTVARADCPRYGTPQCSGITVVAFMAVKSRLCFEDGGNTLGSAWGLPGTHWQTHWQTWDVLVAPEAQAALRCSDAPFLQCCLNVHISLLDNGRKRRIGWYEAWMTSVNQASDALTCGYMSPSHLSPQVWFIYSQGAESSLFGSKVRNLISCF